MVVFIRGDLEINETKLVNYLKDEIHPAVITEECGLNAGYIGPVGLKINGDSIVLYDRSLENRNNLSCGANEDEYHYKGLDMQRDVPDAKYHDFAKAYEGGICPKCGKKTIRISRGIEVGNIFQLGDKYTKAMNMTYVDQNGESKTPIMGCYGIPLRVIVSPRNIKQGVVEVVSRDKTLQTQIKMEEAAEQITNYL